PAPTEVHALSLHDALPISIAHRDRLFDGLHADGEIRDAGDRERARDGARRDDDLVVLEVVRLSHGGGDGRGLRRVRDTGDLARQDRKSTRLNSSHVKISYA